MIQCPGCSNTLQDHAVRCQFCGADVSKVPRPPAAKKAVSTYGAPAKWIWPTYYTVSGYWALSGAFDVVRALGLLSGAKEVDSFMVVIGAVLMLIGVGLILRVELIRGIINVVCWLKIAVGIVGAILSLGIMALFGAIGILFLVLNLLDIATGGFMIYLVGETD